MTVVEATLEELVAERGRRLAGERIADEADRLSGSLSAFIRAGWHVVEPHSPYVHGWHVDAVCEQLERVSAGDVRRLQIWIPPGTMKSRTVSIFWPTWEWTTRPELRYLTGSYDLDLATDFAVLSRDLIRSDWYQARWGHVFQLKSDVNLKRSYANDQGGRRFATSPSSGGTGRHAHRIVIDDPINAKAIDATSQATLDEVISWHDGTLSTRHADPRTGVEVIIMQRLHERDLAGHVLERGGWTVLCLPERYERAHPFVWPDDPRSEGDLLWPERIGPAEHEERAGTLGAHRAAGQLQQRPAARQGEILKRGDWRFYVSDPDDLEQASKLPAFTQIVCSWDTSFKEKTTSDYVVGTVWGVAAGDRYLLRIVRGRLSLAATKTAMLEARGWALARWPRAALRVLIEKSANGVEIIEQLKREVPGVVPITVSVDKSLRAEAAAPDLESGNLYLRGVRAGGDGGYEPAGTPADVQAFVEECAAFPNASHDDQVDSFTQAINWVRLRPRRQVRLSSPAGRTLPRPLSLPGGSRF